MATIADNRIFGFVARVGGMAAAPRVTLTEARVASGDIGRSAPAHGGPAALPPARGGLTDLLLILLLQLVAVHLERIVGAVWLMVEVSYAVGMSVLLNTVTRSVLYPVVAVFLGTVVLSFLSRGRPGRERMVDLAALCAIPPISLDLLLTLASGLSGFRPGPTAVLVATGVGAIWYVALLVLALGLVRNPAAREEGGEVTTLRRAVGGGIGVMAVILVLLTLNLVWVAQRWDELRPVSSGQAAPDFELPRHGGGVERLNQHRGKVVLVSFWASWCGPCLREMPLLAQMTKRHGPRGFKVLAINVEGSPQKVKRVRTNSRAARQLTMLVDTKGEATKRYRVGTLPHLVVVDRKGDVAHVQIGAGGIDRLKRVIERALELKTKP